MSSKKFTWGLFSLMIVAILVLSACGPAAKTAAPATAAPAKSTEVEIFSWWVGPGEADDLAIPLVASGRIAGELPIEEAAQEKIMQLAMN